MKTEKIKTIIINNDIFGSILKLFFKKLTFKKYYKEKYINPFFINIKNVNCSTTVRGFDIPPVQNVSQILSTWLFSSFVIIYSLSCKNSFIFSYLF